MAWGEQRSSGRWNGKYRDANGHKQRVPGTFRTQAQAVAAAELEEEKIGRGSWLDPAAGERTLADYFDRRWIVARRLEANGRIGYRSNFDSPRAGIRKTFGHLPIKAITQAKVQAWVDQMVADAEVMPGTIVQGRYGTLHAILAARRGPSAINDRLIAYDPCAGVVLPHVPEREVNIYTPDQVDALVDQLDPWWRLLVWLDSEIGARWSELCALRPMDVDLDNQTVTIRRGIVQVGQKESKNGTPFLLKPYPKGRKWRIVGISGETCEMIRFHIKGRNLAEGDLLFAAPVWEYPATFPPKPAILVPEVMRTDVWPEGYPVEQMLFAKIWRRACVAAEIPVLRRHDLRASFISWLLSDPSLTPLQVMEIVGHTNWQTTRRYAKTLTGTQKAGVAAISGVRAKFRANARQQQQAANSGDAAAEAI